MKRTLSLLPRNATNGDFALRNDRFAAGVASSLAQHTAPGKPGPPARQDALCQESFSEWGLAGIAVCPGFALHVSKGQHNAFNRCRVPDEYLLKSKRPLLFGREVLTAVVAQWIHPDTTC